MIDNVKKIELDNGIKIITESIPFVRSVSIGLWLNVGSRDEFKEQCGITHFFEHMIFKGTKKRTAKQIAMELERTGGGLNAFTGKEHVCVYAQVLDDAVDDSIDVICDLITNPLLKKNDIELERSVIIEEINGYKDSPEDLVQEMLFKGVWPRHSLGEPITGNISDVQKITQNDLSEFHESILDKGEILIVVVGNIEHEKVVNSISKKLSKLSNRVKTVRKMPLVSEPSKQLLHREDINQVYFSVGFTGLAANDKRKYALYVLNALFGDGMSSRLFQNLREEKGLVYSIYTSHEFFWDTGIMELFAITVPDKLALCQELIGKEISRIKKESVSDDELLFAKSYLKGGLILSTESVGERMNRLAKMELYMGSIIGMEDTIKSINVVTKDDVIGVAEDIFRIDSMSIASIAPKNVNKNAFDVLIV